LLRNQHTSQLFISQPTTLPDLFASKLASKPASCLSAIRQPCQTFEPANHPAVYQPADNPARPLSQQTSQLLSASRQPCQTFEPANQPAVYEPADQPAIY